jgi:hypothetical protein
MLDSRDKSNMTFQLSIETESNTLKSRLDLIGK